MREGSLETVTTAPLAEPSPTPKAGTFIPPTIPPIGYVPAVLAAKALWGWTFFGNPSGPQPVPPTPDEMQQAAQLASMLSTGQATIVISGSVPPAP